MRTIHLVSHTHWDREWYLTFQQFHLKLVHLIDRLIGILDNDQDYKYFLLDGQAVILEDYLQLRPWREDDLRRLVKSGRLIIGPWYISPDEFLISPESHVRNLLEGNRICQEFGSRMLVGYLPDTFGHIGQMPQILRGFGIETACFWRGLDDQPSELIWKSPDGSQVLLSYLREGYGNAANLSTKIPERFSHEIHEMSNLLLPYSSTGQILLMNGTDHMEPLIDLTSAIEAYRQRSQADDLVQSSLPLYFDAVRAQVISAELELPIVTGELRSPKRSPLLQDVLSTRMWIKQRNLACENQLLKWVEPLSAWCRLLNTKETLSEFLLPNHNDQYLEKQDQVISFAWKLLMQCHPHDSICGTSIDQVADEMRIRFDQVDQINQAIITQDLPVICRYIDTTFPGDSNVPGQNDILSSIVVFNPNDQPQSGLIDLNIRLDEQFGSFEIIDDHDGLVPYHQLGSGASELISMTMDKKALKQGLGMVYEGNIAGMVVRDFIIEPQGEKAYIRVTLSDHGTVDLAKWHQGLTRLNMIFDDPAIDEFIIHAYSDPEINLSFVGRDIPGHGYRCYWVRGKVGDKSISEKPKRVSPIIRTLLPVLNIATKVPFFYNLLASKKRRSSRKALKIENEYFVVEVTKPDGSLSITDKQTNQVYHGLNRFVDSGDSGDLYNYCPPEHDEHVNARITSVELDENLATKKLIITLTLRIPAKLAGDRKSRSREKVNLKIISSVILIPGVPRVDIHTELDNTARDHRLKVHFPAPFTCSTVISDGHYELVERSIGIPAYDDSWVEQPQPEVPQRKFTLVTDGTNSLTIANQGLPEVEASKTGSGNVDLAITLLRCVGWLSRDDMTTRKGHAGPMGIAVPGAQMLGWHSFDYSIIPGNSDIRASIHQAEAFTAPLRSINEPAHQGPLPHAHSFIENLTPDFIITTIKLGEDGSSLVVRGYNILSSSIEVKLKLYRPFKLAQLVSLGEEPISALPIDSRGEVFFNLDAKKIATLRFMD